MNEKDISVLSNEKIPESVRSIIAEQMMSRPSKDADREVEKLRVSSDRQKMLWNTPFVAALAGLLTLSATYVVDHLSARDQTENTITLEQVRKELELSAARLKQELESESSENLARLEAEAEEREFQYEIVRSELEKEGKTNAQRASILLFLARAGVLSALKEDELRAMAQEQKENPDQEIIPQLSSNQSENFLTRMWKQDRIPVCWENPSEEYPDMMELVKTSVSETWEANSRLSFDGWGPCADSVNAVRIRIDDVPPHSKALGRHLAGVREGVVLNFSFERFSPACAARREFCVRGYAVHEFGHVLGFVHEHNRPDRSEECTLPSQGADDDFFLSVTPYDPNSVMNFCNPNFANAGELSEIDKQRVSFVYGPTPLPHCVFSKTC